MKIPGFTAEHGYQTAPTSRYRMSGVHSENATTTVIPQLWRNDTYWQCNNGKCRLVTVQNWYDDPGGWGVPPWIGDVGSRQCVARCNKIKNPAAKADCLDAC